jgi:glc operon protein GlcG
MQYGPSISLQQAQRVASAALAQAQAGGHAMVVAVTDTAGHLITLSRIDDTQFGSVDVAVAKARSAVGFKAPTKAFQDAATSGFTAILGLAGGVPIEGGELLVQGGRIVGAIGVSGGQPGQDGEVARTGVAALERAAP